VAQIGRAQHDLGNESGKRRALDGEGTAPVIDGAACYPATSTVQLEDHIAGTAVGLDLRRQSRRIRCRRKALECRKSRPTGEAPGYLLRVRHRLAQSIGAAKMRL
jgi:hypothetical protein